MPENRSSTRYLPTDRITFAKQLSLLRAYAVASGSVGDGPVTNKAVAEIVDMAETTTTLANAFFIENRFLLKSDKGFTPAPEVRSFARAHDWNPKTAAHKLAPLVRETWFAKAVLPRVLHRDRNVSDVITTIAEASKATPKQKGRIAILLDYMISSGLVQRDGTLIKRTRREDGSKQEKETPHQDDRSEAIAKKPAKEQPAIATSLFTHPTEGVVQFHVSVKVDMEEFAGWPADRIAAFFSGIAQVLAAKGAIEEAAT